MIEPGTCVTGHGPGRARSGPDRLRECVGIADESWPAPVRRRSLWWTLVYTVSLSAFGWIPLLAGVPALVLLG